MPAAGNVRDIGAASFEVIDSTTVCRERALETSGETGSSATRDRASDSYAAAVCDIVPGSSGPTSSSHGCKTGRPGTVGNSPQTHRWIRSRLIPPPKTMQTQDSMDLRLQQLPMLSRTTFKASDALNRRPKQLHVGHHSEWAVQDSGQQCVWLGKKKTTT